LGFELEEVDGRFSLPFRPLDEKNLPILLSPPLAPPVVGELASPPLTEDIELRLDGTNASLSFFPTGDWLRREAEGGAARVSAFMGGMVPVEEKSSALASEEGIGSEGMRGDEEVKKPACEGRVTKEGLSDSCQR